MKTKAVGRMRTGIPGFEWISDGGLPSERATLIAGSAGSGKSVFSAQFLANGIKEGESGVFVSFEESADAIRKNMKDLGWDIEAFEKEGKWAFVDASMRRADADLIAGEFDLSAIMERIRHAVEKVGASRVVLDSFGQLQVQFGDKGVIRTTLCRIVGALEDMGVTSLITAERSEEYGPLTDLGVEAFAVDNVIVMRNALELGLRRRTIEIVKFRGASHHKGEFPFTITNSVGVQIVPLAAVNLSRKSTDERATTGVEALDGMVNGGFFRDGIVLVSGASGCGKTLIGSHFIQAGADNGEVSLFFSFEEGEEQIRRNARGWGMGFGAMSDDGPVKVRSAYPESAAMEDHLISLKRLVEELNPRRVVVDGLNAIERIGGERAFQQFAVGLTAYLRDHGCAAILTNTMAPEEVMRVSYVSTLADAIVLLRYVEVYGEMHRAINVMKMRGSNHSKEIREMTIDDSGLKIGKPLRSITGIFTKYQRAVSNGNAETCLEMFGEGD